jgi:putative SOS response-associated peptidase YedK
MFRAAYAERRLVPAAVYYEWRGDPDGNAPFANGSAIRSPSAAYEWSTPDGETLRTFATIATDANRQLAAIQDSMPVIIDSVDWPLWLGQSDGDPGLAAPGT